MKGFYNSLLNEYGLKWAGNRFLYALKLKTLKKFPKLENLFETTVMIKDIDIFKININEIKKFLSNLSQSDKEYIIKIADQACEGKIWSFSSMFLDYGNPIKWNYNPITKKSVDNSKKWFYIPDFDENIGDIKVIWEASRFTHFYYIARAFLITGDKKYYYSFSNQIKEWITENRYSYGANYKCGQENALRMINILMVYPIFKQSGLITKDDDKNIKEIIKSCYKKIISNFFYAHKCIKNNHTFSEICGLMVGAVCSKDKKALIKSIKLLNKEIKMQFNEDGGFTQYSFNYHRFTLQILNVCMMLANQNGMKISGLDRIKKSVELLYMLLSDEGDLPNYGSNDGALIFPLSSSDFRDFRHVINTTYTMITNKKLFESGNFEEELIWFTGTNNYELFLLKKESRAFKDSGYYIFKHDNGFLLTLIQNYKSRPAHMDQLHIDVWHKNVNVFCDLGTYSYASELGKKLSSTLGHNTVKVDGLEQMNKKDTFFVMDWTKCQFVKFDNNVFNGKIKSKNGYTHERIIKLVDNFYYIVDRVSSKNTCKVQLNTPCDIKKVDKGLLLSFRGKNICKIYLDNNYEITQIERSLYYHKYEMINKINIYCNKKNNYYENKIKIELL